MITINGVPFQKHPDIGLPGSGERVCYRRDYGKLFSMAAKEDFQYQVSLFRQLILDDLWFVTNFIVKPFNPGKEAGFNQPFTVQACNEVQAGPDDYTIDIWAREHFKSSILTVGETIQDVLKDPNEAVGLFSYVRPIAKKFLFSIKEIFTRERILFDAFQDRVWENPEKEAPLWSLDEGIILKRSGNRKEATVSAWGLTEGMPTSQHFGIRKYDDITTEDIAKSPSVMEDVKLKFDSSQNLGTAEGTHRVIGTIYHHNDPLIYVRNKKVIEGDQKQYFERFKPATDTGLINGKPVLLSEKRLNALKTTKTFQCQQLLDPTPEGDMKLDPVLLQEIERQFIPPGLFKILLVDPAGDDKSNKTADGDAWSIILFGIEPGTDETGAWNRYVLDAFVDKLDESQAVDIIANMYMKGGLVSKLGYEKFSNFTPAVAMHVIELLKKKGRHVSEIAGSFVWLRPAGRNKHSFIKNALQWPLNNSKWFISKGVPVPYRERIKEEMRNFPLWHDDALNTMAYLDDIVKDETFRFRNKLSAVHSKKLNYAEMGI